jgi:predicted RecA/RadA family phage recombinase
MFLEVASPSELVKDFGYAHSAALSSKVPAVINSRVFIPLNTSLADERNALVYETEVLNAPKTAAEAWVAGAPIYWDATAEEFTTTATANTLCGFALEAAEAADTVAPLFLFNSFAAVS